MKLVDVIYIAGAGRSGSTLLQRIIGQMDGIFAAGEVTHLWRRGWVENQLCGCGRPFSECTLWSRVVRGFSQASSIEEPREVADLRDELCAFRRLPQIIVPALRTSRLEVLIERYKALLSRLYREIARASGCALVLDSSKYPSEVFLAAEMLDVRLYVLHLVRDSRAVAHAWTKDVIRPEIHWKLEHMPRYPVWKSAAAWSIFNGMTERLENDPRARYLRVRYEDLISGPVKVIEEIMSFLDQDFRNNDFLTPGGVWLEPNHTVSGNPMRFATGWLDFTAQDDWRSALTSFQRTLVGALTYPGLSKYGYRSSVSSGWFGREGDMRGGAGTWPGGL